MGHWLVVAGVVAGTGLLVLLLRRRYAVVVVDGESMLPTLHPGQRLLVRQVRPTMVRAGQIVVLGDPLRGRGSQQRLVVKRISALAGEPVPAALTAAGATEGGRTVPAGMIAVLGDNAAASLDSRQCGYVSRDRVRAVVLRPLAIESRERR